MPRPAAEVRRVIKAYDVRGLVGVELDEGFVADVGAAFARMLRDESHGDDTELRVAIGHDMRASSPALAAAFAEGVIGQGLDALSAPELAERIEALKAEIARLEAAIQAREATRLAASAVFKI